MLRICGLCTCGAVDYDASHLWITRLTPLRISGLGEKWSWRYRSPLQLRRGSGGGVLPVTVEEDGYIAVACGE